MKYTNNHFKNLYHIAREEGIKSALKYDVNETEQDLEDVVIATIIPPLAIVAGFIGAYEVLRRAYKGSQSKSV